ncbi:3-methyladenine DNA glycosylase AlkC [Rathayibacter oskolensis]|uniref:3-methyladenine DNA glycosylase AlkC n=1 Tax=Rathayibacter oskolensis TaxID=1891671 RepID=A0A1X7P2N9_9MICO|nr:DNA alkylation repair protein [Rathayibacter oskolensis]SMH44063.1 3-methyladenine DNA glycosylase AlkC [Rathayibacter oskolensis]
MPFADELIGVQTARSLHAAIRAAAPTADLERLATCADLLGPLALRARADLLRDALLDGLPGDYVSFATTIRAARDLGGIRGWAVWPVTSAVAEKALAEGSAAEGRAADGGSAAFEDALALLAELTGLLTSEFAVRALLQHDLDRALRVITETWTVSPDVDVRRLATEGTRPYLPWSVRVPEITRSPGITVPILDRLYRDDSEYVRRSVANHLNDVSRDAADLVVGTARRWLSTPDENTLRVVNRGLRTLVKRGHPGALELLGFSPANLETSAPVVDTEAVEFGGELRFRASIRNVGSEPARLSVDYTVHHVKANGTRTGKTFKLTTLLLAPGEEAHVDRTHSFRALTTRRYHPGAHAVELHVNGVSSGATEFELLPPPPSAS